MRTEAHANLSIEDLTQLLSNPKWPTRGNELVRRTAMVGSTRESDGKAVDHAAIVAGRVAKRKVYEAKPDRSTRRDERREVMVQAKATWEELRPKATSKEKSEKLVASLLTLLSRRIVEFVFRHDGSRIVQWMLADGTEKQKKVVFAELMEGSKKPAMEGQCPFFVQLACDRYGHHLALKLLRVADKANRALIFDRYLRGNAYALVRSTHGADVLDFAFQTVLNARSKAELVIELLYARETKILDSIRSRLIGEGVDFTADVGNEGEDGASSGHVKRPPSSRHGFAASLTLVDESFRNVVVESATSVLNQLVDKDSLVGLEIVHCALKEYMDVVMTSYPAAMSQELAALLSASLVHLSHTKAGISVAVNCVKVLDAKHRKKVVRSLKSHVRKLLENEYGHRLIMALFEWVDDTKLVGKTVTTEIFSSSALAAEFGQQDGSKNAAGTKSAVKKRAKKPAVTAAGASVTVPEGSLDLAYVKEMCMHKYGRMPLLNLLFPRNTRYFHPDVYGQVWSDIGEEKFGRTSKKDPELRREELRSMFDQAIREVMAAHAGALIQSHWSAPIMVGTLLTPAISSSVADAVGSLLSDMAISQAVLENMCGRKTVNTLLKLGGKPFSETILDKCGTDVVVRLALTPGCLGATTNLLTASENKDAARAIEKAKKEIAAIVGNDSSSKTMMEDLMNKAQVFSSEKKAKRRKRVEG